MVWCIINQYRIIYWINKCASTFSISLQFLTCIVKIYIYIAVGQQCSKYSRNYWRFGRSSGMEQTHELCVVSLRGIQFPGGLICSSFLCEGSRSWFGCYMFCFRTAHSLTLSRDLSSYMNWTLKNIDRSYTYRGIKVKCSLQTWHSHLWGFMPSSLPYTSSISTAVRLLQWHCKIVYSILGVLSSSWVNNILQVAKGREGMY